MHAYCYASGLIEFGRKVPDGALPIAHGPAKKLRDFIDPVSRHGYRTEIVKGRPTKIPGTDHLLVPGIPERSGQAAKMTALKKWLRWIEHGAPKGVSVHP
jgi:hypothetical protein